MTHHGNPDEHDNQVHTTPEEGHPAGDGERSERDIGGPTAPEGSDEEATGGATGTRSSEFDSHDD
jgi:hypothetical protein